MNLSVKYRTWCILTAQQVVKIFLFKCVHVRDSPAGIVFLTDFVYVTVQEDCKHLCLGYHFPDSFNNVDFVNYFPLITQRQCHLHYIDDFLNPSEMPGFGIA